LAEESPSGSFLSSRIKTLIEMIDQTQEKELSCDEFHAYLGQFAELSDQGKAARVLPLVGLHLKICSECRQEYEALMRILQAQGGG